MQLFFDLDGTLTDPRLGITRCIAHALERLERPVPTLGELERCIGPPLALSFAELLQTDDADLVAEAIEIYRERFGEVGLYENELFEGVPELLGELREEGRRLRVVTSKPTVYAERITAHFELDRHFDEVHGSELSGRNSHKGELIAHVLDSAGLEGQDCVMIGDRSHDVEGARANGLRSVGVLWGFGSRDELERAGADAIAADQQELREALLQHERDIG